jgi:hypothetical protein
MTWQRIASLDHDYVHDVAVDVSGRVYVAATVQRGDESELRVYWSDDDGAEWTSTKVGPSYAFGRIAPRPRGGVALLQTGYPATILVTRDGGVWESHAVPEEGVTHYHSESTNVGGPVTPSEIACVETEAGESFVLSGTWFHSYTCEGASAIYRFDLGSPALRSVHEAEEPLATVVARGPQVLALEAWNARVRVSADGCGSWELRAAPFAYDVGCVARDGGLWVAGYGPALRVLRSADGARSWRDAHAPTSGERVRVERIAGEGERVGLLLAGARAGLLTSDDGGVTWAREALDLEGERRVVATRAGFLALGHRAAYRRVAS